MFFVAQFVHPVKLPVESISVRAGLSVSETSDHLTNSAAGFLLFLCFLGRVTPCPVDKTQANHAQYRETCDQGKLGAVIGTAERNTDQNCDERGKEADHCGPQARNLAKRFHGECVDIADTKTDAKKA